MNKRKNKIFIACLSFLVVLSIGYAAFSENITVSGSSKSQATFNITTTCTKGLPSNIQTKLGLSDLELLTLNRGYSSDTCSVSGNNVTIGATFEYPTASRLFTIKMTNNSTMDAMLKLNTEDDPEYAFLSQAKIVATTSGDSYTYTYGVEESGVDVFALAERIWLSNKLLIEETYVEDSNGNLSQDIFDPVYEDADGVYIKLKKGYSIYFVIMTKWEGEHYDSNYDDYSITSTAEFVFPFVQYTTDMEETTLEWGS